MNQLEIGQLAKRIWDYHHVNQQLKKADCIMVMGSNDIRVAKRGAELFLEGWAPWIVFSGGVGKLTEHLFKKPEAEVFADIALEMGVSREKILIENTSTNIGGEYRVHKKAIRRERHKGG